MQVVSISVIKGQQDFIPLKGAAVQPLVELPDGNDVKMPPQVIDLLLEQRDREDLWTYQGIGRRVHAVPEQDTGLRARAPPQGVQAAVDDQLSFYLL